MKIEKVHVENFGTLHQYTLELAEGLTVVEEPNGFGKTTLAEFIRAMFYGFPRKAKTLGNSPRQKYLPWSGGPYGGSLTFRLGRERYRVERTFGATPRGDSFRLINLHTGKDSARFSADIGTELFGLDTDAFARSTYLPQLCESGPLSTDSIRAKLSDLVEDADDIGNYEKAVAALRARRSAYIPYKGAGGAVAAARGELSRLQGELANAENAQKELRACRAELDALSGELDRDRQALEETRGRIIRASEAAAIAATQRQYAALLTQKDDLQAWLTRLDETYVGGFPEESAIDMARSAAEQSALLARQEVTTPEDACAQALIEANRARFSDGVPSEETLEDYRSLCREAQTLASQAQSAALPSDEEAQLARLRALHDSGALDEQRLDAAAEADRTLLRIRSELESLTLSDSEQEQFAMLQAYFSPGLPTEDALSECRQQLEEGERLTSESRNLSETLPASTREAPSRIPVPALLIFGTAAFCTGIFLWLRGSPAAGAAILCAGTAALLCTAFLHRRRRDILAQIGKRKAVRKKLDAIAARSDTLMAAARAFTSRYTQTEPPAAALREIRARRDSFTVLSERQNTFRLRRQTLSERLRQQEETLRRELGDGDFERTIVNRRLDAERYAALEKKERAAREKAHCLQLQAQQAAERVGEFLRRYIPDAQPETYPSALAALSRDAAQYTAAQMRIAEWQARKTRQTRELASRENELDTFFESVSLAREKDPVQQLLRMRDDRKNREETARRLERVCRELEDFSTSHEKALTSPAENCGEDIETLQHREKELIARMNERESQKHMCRQRENVLLAQAERIPALQDAAAEQREKMRSGEEAARLLDGTMEYLERARENLATAYLEPIRQSFSAYLAKFSGGTNATAFISPELDVQLEQQGQARELAFFSAGQTDTIWLCMRLALVDALFPQEKPCIILDDPFVNLDDAHTAAALQLLRELGEERQLLYLCCNSSRSPQKSGTGQTQ